MWKNDSMYLPQIREMFAPFPFEAILRTDWFKLAMMIIAVFDPIGKDGSLVFRAMNLEHV